jgi:hypothetical protein
MRALLTIIASGYGLLITATFTCEIVHWRRARARLAEKTLRLPDKALADLFGVQLDETRRK